MSKDGYCAVCGTWIAFKENRRTICGETVCQKSGCELVVKYGEHFADAFRGDISLHEAYRRNHPDYFEEEGRLEEIEDA